MENKQLQESLKRYKQLLGYDEKKGGSSLTEKRERHTYLAEDELLNEADPEEGEETPAEGGEEGGENTDFDFGGEGEEAPAEGGEEGFGEEAPAEGEEESTDLGTADEFSAADEIETEDSGDEVEEIDVTDIVKRADDAKEYAEKAVTAAEEGNTMIKDLMSQFEKLQASLSKIDSVSNELTSIKKDIQSQKPKEKLELRSLDSYPFNVKLTDYWSDEKLKDNYEVSNSETQQTYTLKPEDTKDYSESDIKKSFVPESKAKKKILTENKYKYCSECGNKLNVNDTFCDECGTKQDDLEQSDVHKISGTLTKKDNQLILRSQAKFLDGTKIDLSIRDKCNDCTLPINKEVEILGSTKNGEKPGFNNPLIVKSPKDIKTI